MTLTTSRKPFPKWNGILMRIALPLASSGPLRGLVHAGKHAIGLKAHRFAQAETMSYDIRGAAPFCRSVARITSSNSPLSAGF
jgi:hypothetical protein